MAAAAEKTDEVGKLNRVKLTPVQNKMWEETVTMLMWSQQAFADIWYSLMTDPDGKEAWFTSNLKAPAGTDDKYVYINADLFFKYKLSERVFILCHEILHATFEDCKVFNAYNRIGHVTYNDGVKLKMDADTFQRAMDMRINVVLVESRVGEMPGDASYDPQLVTTADTLIDAYRKVYVEKQKQKQKQDKGNEGDDGGNSQSKPGFDEHMKPGAAEGKTEEQAAAERSDGKWEQGVAAAMDSARKQGKLPAGLERVFGEKLQPKTTWQDKVRIELSRKLGNSGSSWNALDVELMLRGIGAPGRVKWGAGEIWLFADTSGSITQRMLDVFLAEGGGVVSELNPRQTFFGQIDARVQEFKEICDETDLYATKIKGGGGTDFRPAFQLIEKLGGTPDAVIYFTDLEGSFPSEAPPYPVIWACINDKHQAPFGTTIHVPMAYDDEYASA